MLVKLIDSDGEIYQLFRIRGDWFARVNAVALAQSDGFLKLEAYDGAPEAAALATGQVADGVRANVGQRLHNTIRQIMSDTKRAARSARFSRLGIRGARVRWG